MLPVSLVAAAERRRHQHQRCVTSSRQVGQEDKGWLSTEKHAVSYECFAGTPGFSCCSLGLLTSAQHADAPEAGEFSKRRKVTTGLELTAEEI